MAVATAVRIGAIRLKNPLICGAGEHLMTPGGIRAALEAGAGAVIAKSFNESAAARDQLDRTDYVLLDSRWNRLAWDFAPPPDAQLFCRSGLIQRDPEEWIATLAELDKEARTHDAFVIASLILADLEAACALAREVEAAGIRILELNIGAPHGDEAARGSIALERRAERVTMIVRAVRAAVTIPLWVKLTGQSEDVAGLAAAAQRGGADAVTLAGRFMAFVPDIETQAPMLGTRAAIGGPWALALTCRWLAEAREHLGAGYPLIATNGARTGLDIVRFLLAGGTAVQMTSAVLTSGFQVVDDSLEELAAYLARHKLAAEDLIGRAADRLQGYQEQPARPGHWRAFVPPEAGEPE